MKGRETSRLNLAAALFADSILAPFQTQQRLFDGSEFILGSVVDGLQRLVVLELNRPITPVPDQSLTTPLQVGLHSAMAVDEGALAGQKGLLDVNQILLWNRHALDLPYRCGAGKMACGV
jgi:hypothetical protein